jgi:hypothetical protein
MVDDIFRDHPIARFFFSRRLSSYGMEKYS